MSSTPKAEVVLINGVSWTEREEAFLKANHATMTHEEMSRHMDRTVEAVRHRCKFLGLSKRPRWTAAEEAFLTANFGKMTQKEIAIQMGRSLLSVQKQALRQGLCRPKGKPWTEEDNAFLEAHRRSMTYREMAVVLGRTHGAVTLQCHKLSKLSSEQERDLGAAPEPASSTPVADLLDA